MPVEQRDSTAQLRAIAIAVVALAFAVLLGYATFRATSSNSAPSVTRADTGLFSVGDSKRLARQIEADGPLLLSDVSGKGQNRPVFVGHHGDDPATGWEAGDARPPGAAEDCFLEWKTDVGRLRAKCDTSAFDDGGGYEIQDARLRHYPVEVTDNGLVQINLKPDEATSTTQAN